jgi:hypothetical protein
VPTFVDIAGGPKGDGLKQQIEAGQYPGIVKTTLDGLDQRAYLEDTSEKSARDFFFYFSGATPSAVRYKNWKMYYTMSQPSAEGWILPLTSFHFTLVQNIKRDPFEQAVGTSQKTVLGFGGALAGPVTGFLYDWNMLPIGQQLWRAPVVLELGPQPRCRRARLETDPNHTRRVRPYKRANRVRVGSTTPSRRTDPAWFTTQIDVCFNDTSSPT